MIRVLHTDDAPGDHELVVEFLSRIDGNIELDWASSFDDAVNRLARKSYDCILSDFQMPGKNGLTLLKYVREIDPDTPFIFLTGQGNEQLAEEAFNSGANDYFTKRSGFALYNRLANSIKRVVASRRETIQRIRFENALSAIVQVTSPKTGQEYFDSLLINLTKAVGMNFGIIAEKHEDMLTTISHFAEGRQLENMTYPIAGTACEVALRDGFCYFPENMQTLFPNNAYLRFYEVESYCAVRLEDREGNALGVLCLMHDKKLNDQEFILSLVKIFATRASAEMERLQIMNSLKESEDLYRTIFNTVENPITIHELEPMHILDANKAAIDATGLSYGEVLQMRPDSGIEDEFEKKEAIKAVVENLHRAAAGEVIRTEKAILTKSGEWVLYDIVLKRIIQGGKTRVVAFGYRPRESTGPNEESS